MNATVPGPDPDAFSRKSRNALVEIAGADYIEAGRLQGLCDQAGIVGGGRQRACAIGGIADDERNAFFSELGIRGGNKAERDQGQECNDASHKGAHEQTTSEAFR
jgi:hypothetical protein